MEVVQDTRSVKLKLPEPKPLLLIATKKSIKWCAERIQNTLIPGGGSGEMGELAEAAPKPPRPLLVVDEEEEDWSVAWGEGANSPRMTRRW